MRYASKNNKSRFSFIHVAVILFAMLLVVPTVFFSTEVEAANENTVNSEVVTQQATEALSVEPTQNETENVVALQRAIVIDEAKKETEIEIEKIEKEKAQKETEQKEEEKEESSEQSSQSDSSSDDYYYEEEEQNSGSYQPSFVTPTPGSGQYLLDIENPDPNYAPYVISLSDSDRDLIERIVMGETGYDGYTSMCLVAQCIRDAYIKGNYSSVLQLKSDYGYCGVTSITPSRECKEAVAFIFDQGGAAVQHRVLCYYATNYCTSSWHESQNFVCQVNYQRFFDFRY